MNFDDIKARANLAGVLLEFPLEVQFQWMSRLLPGSKNIGVLYNPAQNLKKVESATRIAERMGLKLYAQKVESPSDIPDALEFLSKRVDALWGLPERSRLHTADLKTNLTILFSKPNSAHRPFWRVGEGGSAIRPWMRLQGSRGSMRGKSTERRARRSFEFFPL